MTEAEQRGVDYFVQTQEISLGEETYPSISCCKSGWEKRTAGFEAFATELKLITVENCSPGGNRSASISQRPRQAQDNALPHQFSLVEPAEDLSAFEYSVLVTFVGRRGDKRLFSITVTVLIVKTTLMKSKTNGAGAGSFTSEARPCRLIARMIALVYNWWSLFIRLVEAEKHYEAIVSRPLLLHGVSKQLSMPDKQHSPSPAARQGVLCEGGLYAGMCIF